MTRPLRSSPSTRRRRPDAAAGRARELSARSSAGTTGTEYDAAGLAAARSSGATRWSRRPASTARRPAGCSPTSTRRRCTIQKFEGNPVHPGSRGRNCAKGPATLNQVDDPERILYPLQARRARAAAGEWERVTLGRGARRHRARASGKALVEGRRNEVMYHVGPARPRAVYHAARAPRLGHRRPQLAHQRLLGVARAPATRSGCGLDRPSPDHANARVHPAALLAPRDRPLLQPARPADHRGQDARAPRSA